MSDYLGIFDISAAGMRTERLRLEVSALNLANAYSVKAPDGSLYRPQRVVTTAAGGGVRTDFAVHMAEGDLAAGMPSAEVIDADVAPRRMQQPDHPYADKDGFIEMPTIDPAIEMSEIMTAVRAYEANVKVVSAAKAMMTRALEIGER
ncbi:flagellar basal body rod protein FlgC [Solimonas sp. K1W22B-7]|uniref:flagellar basal body rod protein FlgC n=1 Tax=Solimonas sp. K1W22B-7 TaxID=2303331 RepID=UPI000E32E7F1|nr:flagellar basal body rod protein FlgC [Solimonas sp. K1W22B-7]AXQ28056.1 flagellar basal body rod protein FlgC [Solimonas sp. K1W22B-7]